MHCDIDREEMAMGARIFAPDRNQNSPLRLLLRRRVDSNARTASDDSADYHALRRVRRARPWSLMPLKVNSRRAGIHVSNLNGLTGSSGRIMTSVIGVF
jgi:hypothetical protein